MNFFWRFSLIWCMTLALFFCTSCAQKGPIFVTPGRHLQPVGPSFTDPVVLVQPFEEKFGETESIGELSAGSKTQKIMIHGKNLSQALGGFVAQELIKEKIPFAADGGWDRTLPGLANLSTPARLVIGGTITHVVVRVADTITHTKYSLELDISCTLGLPLQKKIITRNVHVSEEMITIRQRKEIIEDLLDRGLAEAARQIVTKFSAATYF